MTEYWEVKYLSGILDQGMGHLIVFEEPVVDKTYDAGLSLIAELGKVVDLLHVRAKNLKWSVTLVTTSPVW